MRADKRDLGKIGVFQVTKIIIFISGPKTCLYLLAVLDLW